jgi:GNAT superfamily N-acetyltransferase
MHEEPRGHQLTLTVANQTEYLPAVGDAARGVARIAGFDGDALEYVAAVTTRLAGMLMDPALEPPEGGEIDVVCAQTSGGLHMALHDDGPPFDPSSVGVASDLIHGLLRGGTPDWVLFRNLGRGGKEVAAMLHLPEVTAEEATEWAPAGDEDRRVLGLLIRGDRPGAFILDETREVPVAPSAEGARTAIAAGGAGDIHIGLFRPEQATAVSRCIYDAYHLTYIDESMYRPLRVAELNESGEMISAVATAPDGTVAGHAALVFPDADHVVADLAVVVTRRAWRGHGIAEKLSARLLDEAQRRGLYGVYCDAVTIHPFTQRLARSQGFSPCGFRLAQMPAGWKFLGIDADRAHRGSALVMFRPLVPPADTPLDVPWRHREAIARVYSWMGVHGRLEDQPQAVSLDALGWAALTRGTNEALASLTMTIDSPGVDLHQRVHEELHLVKQRELRVVEARVNLQSPGAGAAAEMLEEMGFLVVGVRPGGQRADWLLLQYFNGVLVDYDGMVLDTDEAKELAAYVRGNDPDAG